MKKILVLALIISCVLFTGSVVLAQDQASDEATTAVFIKERETQRIQDLRILYRDQVEVYRSSERAFFIAKTNFEQVQTLSALEEAVKATKTVMFDRSRVMITYLELIDAVLVETEGIELSLKDQTHTELTGLINLLKIHQENIQVSNDRQAMVLLADDFEPIALSYESLVYKTLSLIRIGKIQSVHDKAEIIETDIIVEHESQEEVGGVKIARRERAYAEVEKNFSETNQNLAKLNESFAQARKDGFTRGFYERVLTQLSPIYAQITRSLDHLEELITL